MQEAANIDFETCSQIDLLSTGAHVYAMLPSTDVLMMYWAIGDDEPEGWFPGDPFPKKLRDFLEAGGRIDAANAQFERLIWWYIMEARYDAPRVKLEQFYCTLYKARCNNMPGSLDRLARALKTGNQKYNARGKELINLFSILDANGRSVIDRKVEDGGHDGADVAEAQDLFDEFCDYCAQDVRAERDAGRILREPTDEEWQDYWVNERINDAGVKIDTELAHAAVQYATEENEELVAEIQRLTDGAVQKSRGEKLKAWVMDRLTEDQLRIMVRHKGGVKKYSLDKSAREELLAEDLDWEVAEVLQRSDMAQKSSVSKFSAMLVRTEKQTGRVFGTLMPNGASGTGRYSSKGLQVHNFVRKVMEDPAEVRLDLVENIEPDDIRDYYELPIMTILSRMLRSAIVAPKGKKLAVADWSSIEGRVAPWLTCTKSGEKKLDQYRLQDRLKAEGADPDVIRAAEVYVINAMNTFGIEAHEVTDHQRQVGKVEELSLQFGGGSNAFMGMAWNYGVNMPKEEAEVIKNAWRAANPWAAGKRDGMWARCESAAFAAIRSPGSMFPVGKVTYFAVEGLYGFDMTLFCELPCGRVLTYPDIRVGQKKAPWGDMVPSLSAMRAGWTPKADAKEWPRGGVYGGLLVENIVQGTAASLLRWALREAVLVEDMQIILHVHDEMVAEAAESEADDVLHVMYEIMQDGPDWAKGLPLAAEGSLMDVYGK